MISTSDREQAVMLINEARASGARLGPACAELGLTRRTYRRWYRQDGVCGDARPDAERPTPANKLTRAEYSEVVDTLHRPEYASLPPGQIVPALADDEQRYIASESTFYRVLRAEDEQHHRGRSQAPRHPGPASTHTAHGPNEVWAADIVRHEAPLNRVRVRDPDRSPVAAGGVKLRAARPRRRGEEREQP
jgi:hypothetical protein